MFPACQPWTYQVRPVTLSHKCGGFKTKHEHKFGWKLDIPTITFWPADWRWCEDCRGRGSNNRVTVDLLTSVLSLSSPVSPANCVPHLTSRHVSPPHHLMLTPTHCNPLSASSVTSQLNGENNKTNINYWTTRPARTSRAPGK